MDAAGIDDAKAGLRREARRRRDAIHLDIRAEASRQACRYFLSSVPLEPSAMVAGYWPIRDELDIRPILAQLMDAGQLVCLPVVTGEAAPLAFRRWIDGEALEASGFGTLAPAQNAPEVVPDMILVPLLGYDRAGTRLGYGGGYYDRTLAALPRRPRLVGFAFSAQQFDHIPRADHDMALDAIVTERGVRSFASKDSAA